MADHYSTQEIGEMFEAKSATAAASQTYPFMRNRMKQAIRYDARRFMELVTMLWREVEYEKIQPMPDDEIDARSAMLEGRGKR